MDALNGRNLVVCLDGTDNQFGVDNTNVVRLFQALDTNPDKQLAYYDPGVGTIWSPSAWSKLSQKFQMLIGLAFGWGVTQNVCDAYVFLMREYRPGDRIFLFGFSRGALEARILAALLFRCGLLRDQLEVLPRYAIRFLRSEHTGMVTDAFRETFSRPAGVHFLGLWDTVTSVGNVGSPVNWANTAHNPGVRQVRHAISIDERRSFFRQNRWSKMGPGQIVDEVWFSGVHSDVGGGYPVADNRLWAITLEWMLKGATPAGLLVDGTKSAAILAQGMPMTSAARSDWDGDLHISLTNGWKVAEFVPKKHHQRNPDGSYGPESLMVPAIVHGLSGMPRVVMPGERVHGTAVRRFVDRGDYRPPTLVQAGLNIDVAMDFIKSGADEWVVPGKQGH